MNANELRIGNWVLDNGFPNKASANLITELWEAERVWCQPIPITPEILVDAGFYLVNHIHGYSFHAMDRKSKKDKDKPSIDIYDNKTLFCSHWVNHCQYVHQLQNLYFALTGEELNIQL
jgi:hypothetical protein